MKRSEAGLNFALLALVAVVLLVFPLVAGAEVRLFVDKNTVRVHDPELGQPSILNNFQSNGHRTHNYMALVWDSNSVWVYDIRTHQWLNIQGFSAVSGLLSDDLAMAWERERVAVFNAQDRNWVLSDTTPSPITGQQISRKMAAVTCEDAFVVYDPVLKTWQTAGDFEVKNAQTGDNLAVAWDDDDVVIYDLTMHQWIVKQGIAPQACIIEPFKVSVYSSDRIHVYDAMSHRWQDMPR